MHKKEEKIIDKQLKSISISFNRNNTWTENKLTKEDTYYPNTAGQVFTEKSFSVKSARLMSFRLTSPPRDTVLLFILSGDPLLPSTSARWSIPTLSFYFYTRLCKPLFPSDIKQRDMQKHWIDVSTFLGLISSVYCDLYL